MIGADQRTGKLLGGTDYLRQRIANAISTPLWTTVMHRGRGGALHELLDTAITPSSLIDIYAAIAQALDRRRRDDEGAAFRDRHIDRARQLLAELDRRHARMVLALGEIIEPDEDGARIGRR